MSRAKSAFTGGVHVDPKQRARADELARLMDHHRARYYAGQPEISDAAFDAIEDELRALDPTNPALARVGSPQLASEWEKARHEIPMGSLNKAVGEDELRAWFARCLEIAQKEGVEDVGGELCVAEKLDGISIEVLYRDGKYADAITRGDGMVGERISPNVRRMKGVPARIADRRDLSVRGEIILRLSDMRAHFPGYASPRNTAAGTSKRFDGEGCQHLTVLFYDIAEDVEVAREIEKYELLRKLGFAIPRVATAATVDDVVKLHAEYVATRAELDYEIDGLVVALGSTRAQWRLGEVHHRPRGSVAFKFASPAKVSKVVSIHWDTGPSGRVTPVAVVEPVELAGASVKRASLHNAARVRTLGIGVGDEVLVSRRNDVIPYVEEVVTSAGSPAAIPTACGTCGAALVPEGEYLNCKNTACTAIIAGRILNWVGAIGALEWGDKLVLQLVEAKLVGEPADLYKLTVDDIAALDRRGKKSAEKALAELRSKLPLSLPTFLAALGMEGFAIQTARLIVANGFDTIERVLAATEEELAAIAGLGAIRARAIVGALGRRADEIQRLLAAGIVPVAPAAGGPLAGKSFAFTGASSRPRAELVQMVEGAGGRVLSGVTKDLSYLVIADPSSTSTKAEKARKYGTVLIDEAALEGLIAGG